MRIGIVMQKGGSAKTTTAVNEAATLGGLGKRVLLVDLDSQAALTRGLGICSPGNVWEDPTPLPSGLPGVSLIPGGPGLVKHEMALTVQEECGRLHEVLSRITGYDYALLDCPPNLYGGTTNAIVAADQVLIPVPLSLPAIQSLGDTMRLIRQLREKGHAVPELVTAVVTIYRKLAVEVERARILTRSVPHVLETKIRQSALYAKAELALTAAVLFGGRKSAPVVDHQALIQELGLG